MKSEGDQVTALGFPTETDDWPQAAAVARDVEVVVVLAGGIEHKPSVGNGMSGGPVVDRRHQLVGLVMGHNHGVGRVADVETIRWIIDSSLPHMPPRT